MAARVSVLMPVLNPHPEFFPQAVASILAQTCADFELIITEDPSPRQARELLRRFTDRRIVHQYNEARTSLVDQRNQGLRAATAELVALADADDICEPTRLAEQLEFMAAHPHIDVLGSQLSIIDPAGKIIGERRYPTEHEHIAGTLRCYNPIAQPSVCFRRQRVLDLGGYQYRKYSVNSDYDLWCRLALSGAKFANLDKPLVRYRIHPEGIKTSKLRDVIAATIDIKKTHFGAALGLRGHARLAAERCLQLLPGSWVLKAFMATQYRKPTTTPRQA